MLALLPLLVHLGPTAHAAEGCAPADLDGHLGAAAAAHADLDQAGFDDAMDQAALALSCLDAPLTPAQVGLLQRMQGLRMLGLGKKDLAQGAFAAARRIGADDAFEAAIGDRTRETYTALDPKDRATEDVAPPQAGALHFDGTPGTERPSDWPVFVQHVGADGDIAFSRYLLPGTPLPAYPAVAPPPRGRWALLSSGVLGTVAAGLLVGSAVTFDRYQDPGSGLGIGGLDRLQARNTALFWSGMSAGALALGAGATGVALRVGGR